MKTKKEWFTREYLSQRTVFISFWSLLLNFLTGIVKIIISCFTFSYYFGMNGAYNVVLGSAKVKAVRQYSISKDLTDTEKKTKIENKTCYQLCWFAIASSLIYLVLSIVLTFFFQEVNAKYSISVVCFIAAVGFSKLVIGIINSVKTKHDTNLIIHYIKLLNLVDACVAIALVQRAILMMEGVENANYFSGIGGIIFSTIALMVSIYMIIELALIKKRKMHLKEKDL